MERDSDTWIVVDNFNNGNYYTLVSGVDYSQTSLDESAYECGAINIPTEKNKHLTINTTIDCRTASTQSGSLLYSFINNRGNLTIDGSGTIAVSFNAGNYANAIIFNQGNLIIDAPITLDATCKTVQSYGRAIMNHTGTFTISDGTYIGFKSNTLGTSGNVGALWQACQNINKESIIIGGQFQLKNENGIISDGYALVNGGVDNLTLKGGTFYGIYASQYSLKLSALLGSYCKFQKNGADFNGSSLSDSTDVLSVVNTNLIPTVNLTVTAPMNGDKPSAPSISTENTTIYAHEWKDSSESNMSSFSTFVGGETYRLQVRVNTTKEFSKNTKVYINGQIATVKSFAENSILCYCDFIASNEQIDTVQVGLDTPMVGGDVTAPYTYTNTVDLTLYEWYPDVTQYEAGHNYRLTFRIVPKTGYEFSDDVKVVINGKQATITSQGKNFAVCEYSFEFAAQEPETVNEIVITVDNPVAGGTSPTPTVSSNQYTLGMYEWTPSEFVADSNSRLTVLAYPSSGYKFVDGTTTAKVNGQTATISIGSGYARIEYTFIVSTPSYTVSFNANGGTGSMLDETDQFGGLVLPKCSFTAPTGKQFKCWAEGSTSGTQYDVGDEYDVTGDVTFFAIWEDNLYQVIYQPGEAGGSNEIYEYEVNDIITFLDCEEVGFTFDGFEFDYWSIRILGDNFTEVAQKRASETYTLTTNIIAVAMWKEIPHECVGVLQSGQAATCTVNGWKDYYKCSCGKIYTDAACTNEITSLEEWKVGDGKIVAEHTYGDLIPENPAVHTQTELNAGMRAHYKCSVCDTYFDSSKNETTAIALTIPAPTHSFGDWVMGDEKHWKVCDCGLKSEENSHDYTDSSDMTCNTCGYDRTVPHTHGNGVLQSGQAATCTVNGWKDYYKCSCGKIYADAACTNEITSLEAWKNGDGKIVASHSYGDLIAKVDATCSQTGMSAHYECSVCHTLFDENKVVKTENELTIDIDANAHTYGAWTSNGDGTHTRVCGINGNHKETVACSGGTATCTEKAVCEVCNTPYGNTAAHEHGSEWHKNADEHWNECACGDKANVAPHVDGNNDGKCDTCEYAMGNAENPGGDIEPEKTGLSGGAIAGIAVGSVAVAGLGGFSLFWFVIKKKKFADLIALFKKK